MRRRWRSELLHHRNQRRDVSWIDDVNRNLRNNRFIIVIEFVGDDDRIGDELSREFGVDRRLRKRRNENERSFGGWVKFDDRAFA